MLDYPLICHASVKINLIYVNNRNIIVCSLSCLTQWIAPNNHNKLTVFPFNMQTYSINLECFGNFPHFKMIFQITKS